MSSLTAGGSYADIPTEYDVLVAGPSCVDFSNLNSSKPSGASVHKHFAKEFPNGINNPTVAVPGPKCPRFMERLNSAVEILDCGE